MHGPVLRVANGPVLRVAGGAGGRWPCRRPPGSPWWWRVRPAALALAVATSVGGVAGMPAAAAGQEDDTGGVSLEVDPTTGAATLVLGDLLADGRLRSALHSGLPLRVRTVVELWRDRLFDSQEGQAEWRASVVHDPLGETYRVSAGASPPEEVVRSSVEAASEVLQRPLSVPVQPERPGRYYYVATVLVETLSLSDLEELRRWLRGDVAPVVSGERDVESAVARGVRRLVVRVLGLPARRLRVRTPTFEVGGGEELW